MPLPVARHAQHQESVSSFLRFPDERASGPPGLRFALQEQPEEQSRLRSSLIVAARNGEPCMPLRARATTARVRQKGDKPKRTSTDQGSQPEVHVLGLKHRLPSKER